MKTRPIALLVAALLCASGPGLARADEDVAPPVPVAPAQPAVPPVLQNGAAEPLLYPGENVEAAFEIAEKKWSASTPWRYGTDRFFPLTRELHRSERVPAGVRYGLYVLTVPWDIAYTPIAVIAGLYGR